MIPIDSKSSLIPPCLDRYRCPAYSRLARGVTATVARLHSPLTVTSSEVRGRCLPPAVVARCQVIITWPAFLTSTRPFFQRGPLDRYPAATITGAALVFASLT